MEKKQHKILLTRLENASSEDVEMFLQVDLSQSFQIIAKEKYNNDFDLARQFERERDASRNFRIYGEIASTIKDCDNLIIKLFSDPDYQNLIGEVQTTPVSYNRKNVFGKKKGKYLIEKDNFEFEQIYMQIDSDNFYFQDQRWTQKLVFRDSDGEFISYGNETAEINDDGTLEIIENDFPFFFHKHWIRRDYNIIEEKEAEFSWDIPESTIEEGESQTLKLSLNKPSPFGNELLTLSWSDKTSYDKYLKGNLKTINEESSQTILNLNGNVNIVVLEENNDFFSPGRSIRLTNGDYQGEYLILNSAPLEDFGVDSEEPLLAVELDFNYNSNLSNENTTQFFAGSFPDVQIFHENQEIKLPFDVSWSVDEQEKEFEIVGLEDFEIEFDELFKIESTNLFRVIPGLHPTRALTLKDSTVPKEVSYNFQEVYENRLCFTGRTVYPDDFVEIEGEEIDTSELQTIEGPSVLRNGLMWEGRNEEFYPNDFFDLTIKNEGIKTVIPINKDLGLLEPQLLNPLDSLTIRVDSEYNHETFNTLVVTFNSTDYQIAQQINITSPEKPDLYINGCPIISKTITPANQFESSFKYSFWKDKLNGGPDDIYVQNQIEKPFNISFDDTNRQITFTSKNPGVKIEISTLNPFLSIEETTAYVTSVQLPRSITLYANSNQNQDARYSFTISKFGFKTIEIPPENIPAQEGVVTNVYLSTGYQNILYPYDSTLQQSFFRLNANNVPGASLLESLENQPSYMEKGNAFINGALLLSSGLWPESVPNLTEQLISEGELENEVLYAKFLPAPISVIPDTKELLSPMGTRGVWQILIKDMSSLPAAGTLVGTRSFDIDFGTGSDDYSWTVGGERPEDTITLTKGASEWWDSVIPVYTEGEQMTSIPLYQRLGENNLENEPNGPFVGTVINSNTLQLQAQEFGFQFSINNLQNFDGHGPSGVLSVIINFFEEALANLGWFGYEQSEVETADDFSLRAAEISPSLSPGDINTGRNGLGGFAIEP